jgi:hypothetical protein
MSANAFGALLLLSLLPAMHALAVTGGFHDAEFEKYPLDRWLAENKQSRLRWRVEIPQPELSTHQRLMLRIITHVDGREIDKRRGNGDFMTLLQIQDAAGHNWQNHAALDLTKVHQNVQSAEFIITHFAFVLPGDYTITVAVCDAVTREHSLTVRKLHVAPLRTDPLPNSWTGLPNIEFVNPQEGAPDVWYLPEVEQRLQVAVKPSHPVHVQILVNTTPSERASASMMTMRRNMSVAIPALKILSQVEVPGSSVETALLDLTHRRVPFEQKDPGLLDWQRMRKYFLDLRPGLIDVGALQGQWKMRKFFWEEVTRRLRPKGDAIPVVIVLSGPAFFENQEPLDDNAKLEPDCGRRLFYIRYRAPAIPSQRVRVRPGMRPAMPPAALDVMPVDDLQRTLEPLGARIFDAISAEQFRRVLAAILEQISNM